MTIILVLDDPLMTHEVQNQIKKMNPNKTCGPNGVSPAVFRMLPAS